MNIFRAENINFSTGTSFKSKIQLLISKIHVHYKILFDGQLQSIIYENIQIEIIHYKNPIVPGFFSISPFK